MGVDAALLHTAALGAAVCPSGYHSPAWNGACRTAPPVTYSGPAAVQWQTQRLEDNRDIVRGYLLDEP